MEQRVRRSTVRERCTRPVRSACSGSAAVLRMNSLSAQYSSTNSLRAFQSTEQRSGVSHRCSHASNTCPPAKRSRASSVEVPRQRPHLRANWHSRGRGGAAASPSVVGSACTTRGMWLISASIIAPQRRRAQRTRPIASAPDHIAVCHALHTASRGSATSRQRRCGICSSATPRALERSEVSCTVVAAVTAPCFAAKCLRRARAAARAADDGIVFNNAKPRLGSPSSCEADFLLVAIAHGPAG